MYEGDPGYAPHLDADNDGVACEPYSGGEDNDDNDGGDSEGDSDTYYENCDAARADGVAPLYEGDPGYAPHLDADNDGVACEPYSGGGDDNDGGGGNGDSDAYYENCDAARADGAAPLYEGDPGYDDHLDRDGDGVACEN